MYLSYSMLFTELIHLLVFEFFPVVSVEGLGKSKKAKISLGVFVTLLQLFVCAKHTARSTLCGGRLLEVPTDAVSQGSNISHFESL